MSFNKRTAAGRRERRALLQRCINDIGAPRIDATVDELANKVSRRELAVDDIIDAAILALTAQRIVALGSPGYQRELPSPAPRDAQGLPMAILMPPT